MIERPKKGSNMKNNKILYHSLTHLKKTKNVISPNEYDRFMYKLLFCRITYSHMSPAKM